MRRLVNPGLPARAMAAMSALLLGILTFGSSAPARAEAWKCYTFVPVATDPTFLAHVDLAAKITAATDKRLSLTCHLGGSLPIKSQTIVQAVADNVVQFASANPNAFETFMPFAGILSLPGLFSNDRELETGIKVAGPFIEKALTSRGVRLLGWAHFPQAAIFGTDVIRSVKDLQGKKIRVSTPEQSEMLRRWNSIPVVISSPEVSSSLSTGVIQGVITSNSGGGRAWKELFKSSYRIGTNYTPFLFVANQSSYAALSPADRASFDRLVGAGIKAISDDLLASDEALTREFAAGGTVIAQPAPEEAGVVERTMRDYWGSWAEQKGPDAKAMLAEIRKALGK